MVLLLVTPTHLMHARVAIIPVTHDTMNEYGTEAAPVQADSSVVTAELKFYYQQNDHDLDANLAVGDDGACTTRRI